MQDAHTIKINLPGGIISPGRLLELLTLIQKAKVSDVRFGSRQQLLFQVPIEDWEFLKQEFETNQVLFEKDSDNFPNIISSYCAEGVFRTGQWLCESEYHTVLDGFEHTPALKINLSDSHQSFTPFFTGNLNFIASSEPHFWFLYLRPIQSNDLFRWPELIYSADIARLSQALEQVMEDSGNCTIQDWHSAVHLHQTFITQPAFDEVHLPEFSLPYYEGFNRYGERSWLGLYRRNEWFSIAFLRDLCALCVDTRLGELCTTPWKSLIIKGIEEKNRPQWSRILGRHNINVRHTASELAWQTDEHCREGIALKNYIRSYFEKNDTRTFGLCFGIQTRPEAEVFGSVLIRKRALFSWRGWSLFPVYDLYYTENFNPNSRVYFLQETGLLKNHLPREVENVCRRFNAQRQKQSPVRIRTEAALSPAPQPMSEVFVCSECLTHYDPAYGDVRAGIQAGTPFDHLPPAYLCPTCDAPKSAFELLESTAQLS
ncbi:rubredoxin [Arundinibacter roseus]|uniref:Rubredoxin n=1 Tax=Arundinibacter roseus TaxID=2070510 RepID=A0A4R4K4H5_9BACT|nr:rubredoxin [Arundinibacter roseus]TDB61396.1 rubredoxin [Arundinibacter roseus]